jgi:hypothetical protein
LDQELFDACFRKSNNIDDISWDELARKFGYGNGEILRNRFKREKKKERLLPLEKIEKEDGEIEYRETEEIKSDGTIISDKLIKICESESKTPKSLLIAHGFDPDLFSMIACKSNMWHGVGASKDGDRLIMYQSKLTAKPKSSDQLTFTDIDNFFNNYVNKNYFASPRKNIGKDGDKILEIDLADIHIGSRAFDKNSSQLIQDNFRYTIENIYDRAKYKDLSKIYLIPLGDVFHFDTAKTTTTDGTQLDSNGMIYSEIFDVGASLFIEAIDMLSNLAPLETIYIGGNHDRTFGYFLIKALEFYYRQDDNIMVDSGHLTRKFRKFGKSLVGFCHGDMPKNNISSWLKTEARKEWGETEYSEIHAAHFHSQNVSEKDGSIVRYLCSMGATDSWHYDKGYVNAVKSTVSFLWDKENGLEEMWFTNI